MILSRLQVAVESITNRALAGELDSAETTGTSIQLMNYSYSEDAALSKGALSKIGIRSIILQMKMHQLTK